MVNLLTTQQKYSFPHEVQCGETYKLRIDAEIYLLHELCCQGRDGTRQGLQLCWQVLVGRILQLPPNRFCKRHFFFCRGQHDAVCWCSSGQTPSCLSAKCTWEVIRLPGELLTNTPPSLTHPRRWNQPERLPLLSELLWELVVLKSCDWLCGNLLANPSATR